MPIIAHGEGADPAAVVFDGSQASRKARKADLLIVDTAGRLHNKTHLMEELREDAPRHRPRIPRGGRCSVLLVHRRDHRPERRRRRRSVFREAADLDGIVLTKLDGTAKGGVVISIKEELQLPVYFVGVGEQKDDLQVFNAKDYADAIF